MADILIVEDDERMRVSVGRYLAHSGHSVRGVGSGAEMESALCGHPAEIVILDLGLPDEEGTAIARRLKETAAVGIIMMTARGEAAQRVEGLDCGADYYLVKPVDLDELQAVIRSLSRRMGTAGRRTDANWRLDPVKRTLVTPAGFAITLTGAEYQFLACMMESPGTTVPREVIGDRLGYGRSQFLTGIESVLARLRRKTQSATGLALPVKPVRGAGYVFAGNAERSQPVIFEAGEG